jgi:hypothetical protein
MPYYKAVFDERFEARAFATQATDLVLWIIAPSARSSAKENANA